MKPSKDLDEQIGKILDFHAANAGYKSWSSKDQARQQLLALIEQREREATAELKEELVDFAEDVLGQFGYDGKSGGLSTLEWAEGIIKQHKQELEKL